MKRYYEKYKHIIPLAIFGVIYVLWFYLLEHRTNVQYMVVHMNIDDYIPFCEYFIIPYFMWFGYIAVNILSCLTCSGLLMYQLCSGICFSRIGATMTDVQFFCAREC